VSRVTLTVPGKINLHLQVFGPKRGCFHEVWTLFQSIDLADEISVEDQPNEAVSLVTEPAGAAPQGRDNLVMKAVSALREHTGAKRGAAIRLRKRIPVGAGLGGGSADAAAALVALDRVWKTRLSEQELTTLAADVGSDVAFFLHGGFAVGRGRGDVIERLPDLPPFAVVIVFPTLEISTVWAFAELDRRLTSRGPDATVEAFAAVRSKGGTDDPPWSDLFNDFEEVVTSRWPEIGRMIRAVEGTGPLHAALTGSGAAVFGIYVDSQAARRAACEIGNEWRVHVGSTLGRRRAGLLNGGVGDREEERSWK
jgi:4-diphosphocytidyl-2-C-methyl-D-erythritol kinase